MIAVVDYGIGNLRSAEKALQHLGADARLTADVSEVDAADAVVLPGVGNFGACMRALRESGLGDATRNAATDGRPFLGICVGMQMLFDGSDESPGVEGLGIIGGRITRLPDTVRLPQMGWNTLERNRESRLLAGLPDPAWCYFVHSFAPDPGDERDVAAWCDYGRRFAAAVERGPVWATQFHPEKSGEVGLALLGNFVNAEESRRSTRRSRRSFANPTMDEAASPITDQA
jgi:glutamine amidotransferase